MQLARCGGRSFMTPAKRIDGSVEAVICRRPYRIQNRGVGRRYERNLISVFGHQFGQATLGVAQQLSRAFHVQKLFFFHLLALNLL
jgi:hypothetical protein